MMSDRILEASREGSKGRIYGSPRTFRYTPGVGNEAKHGRGKDGQLRLTQKRSLI